MFYEKDHKKTYAYWRRNAIGNTPTLESFCGAQQSFNKSSMNKKKTVQQNANVYVLVNIYCRVYSKL